MKEKAVVFGAGSKAKMSLKELFEKYDILAFLDNDASVWGKEISGVKIYNPEDINGMEFDRIVFCNTGISATEAWIKQVAKLGYMDTSIIDFSFCVFGKDTRNEFLKDFSILVKERIMGGVLAEVGVSTGEYSKVLNSFFPDRMLHLFDSFEGFSSKDLSSDIAEESAGRYSNTSIDLVMEKMRYPDRVVIHKGWFPDSAKELGNLNFCFVCLDLDLYNPILSGLKLFSRKMVKGGIILVHDYFNDHYPGTKRAVDEFMDLHPELYCSPIGDNMSVIIMGFDKIQ